MIRQAIRGLSRAAPAACAALLLLGPTMARAGEVVYERKDTWAATLNAMRARYRGDAKAERPAAASGKVSYGPWHGTYQLRSSGLSQELFPEKGVDLKAKGTDGKRLWRRRDGWRDGRVINLPNASNSATYMFRTITAPSATRKTIYLGSDDGIAVWLNDKRILFKDVSRGAGPDQDRAVLNLRAGENRLLMKVHNGTGGHGFYFSTKPGGGGGGGGGPVGPLAQVAADFPVEHDWTHQDAGNEFSGWLDAKGVSLEKRMIEKVLEELGSRGDRFGAELRRLEAAGRPGDPRWLELYAEACEARRAKRLAPMLEKWQRIVFTKHHNLGGSHYAYTEAVSDSNRERNFRPNTELCIIDMEGTKAKVRTLIKDAQGVIRDPDVSYDGKRILFAWKKSDREDDYHLYEMDAATEKVRQLTHGLGYADYEGCYLPDGNIVFSSSRCEQTVDCWWTRVSNLFISDSDGKHMRRVGFDQVHTNYPKVMDDGRITYTRWDYNDRGQLYPQPLFQMNMDGTGQSEFYGNNSWFPTTIAHARGIPGTGKVLAIATGHHSYQRGKVCIVDPMKGRQEASGVQLVAPIRETKAVRVDGYGQGGDLFEYPYPLNEREFLVAYSPLGGRRPHGQFGIFFMDVDGKREFLAGDPEIPCNQPVPLVSRPKPHVRPSVVNYAKKTGTYTIQDVYVGPGLEGVERGVVKKLRVVALDFRAAGVQSNGNGGPAGGALVSTPIAIRNGTWDTKIVLGTTPVYEDGSASFEVPARTPVYFQLLDKDNKVVQSMRSWSTLQPGENFSCVGCHENKNNTPMRMKPAIAMRKGAQPLEPFYGPARGFSFIKEIQPILDKHCIRCHKAGDKSMAGGAPSRTMRPGGDWAKPDFDDSRWQSGKAGFGTPGTPGGRQHTLWSTNDVWMRASFDLTDRLADRKLAFWVCHDEDVKIYLNGVLGASASNYIAKFQGLPVAENAACTLQPGKNIIAVHCRQTSGGQFVDVSFVDAGPAKEPRTVVAKRPEPVTNDVKTKPAFSLLGKNSGFRQGGRLWSDSYLALTKRGKPNNIVNWLNVQSIPPMLPPYFAGAAKSDLIKMHEKGGHNKVKLSREELDKLSCWIDLLVPFCGDYREANSWSDKEKAWYDRYLQKRFLQERLEREGMEAIVKRQTGRSVKIEPGLVSKLLMGAMGNRGAGGAVGGARGTGYRNVALNPYDVRGPALQFPHASSNSEHGNNSAYLAKNAINGRTANRGHGGRFPSWGPDKRTDLWWKVEFGRKVEVDKIVLTIRADFPHDRHWHSATIEFSDGSREKVSIEKTGDAQTLKFRKRTVEWLQFTDLVQKEPLGWCGFSEVEVWGKDAAGR